MRSVTHKRENGAALSASCRQLLCCSLIDVVGICIGLALSLGAIALPEQLGVKSWTGREAFGNLGPM